MNNNERIIEMRQRLEAALTPSVLEIIDESHLHAGHAGAKSGKGHFRLTINSNQFAGLRVLKQHQAIYVALGDLMETEIHALAIKSGE